ncbi:MAG: hypothetical protein RR614_00780 [Eubacterium sp.]
MKTSDFLYQYGKEVLAEQVAMIFCQESYNQADEIFRYHEIIKTFRDFKETIDLEDTTLEELECFYDSVRKEQVKEYLNFFKEKIEHHFPELDQPKIIEELNRVYEAYAPLSDKYGREKVYIKMLEAFRKIEEEALSQR